MARAISLVAVALLLSLSGCSEGSSSGCTRAEAAASGPGDVAGLFPVAVGDLWAYRVEEDL